MVLDAELLASMFQQLVGIMQQATDVGADLHMVLAARLAVQHAVVGNHFVDLQRRHADALGDFLNQLIGNRPDFILRIEEHRNHRRALAPGRIALKQLGEPGFQLGENVMGGSSIRISSTKSMLPMAAITSAISVPSTMREVDCRLPKLACAYERGTAAPCVADHVISQFAARRFNHLIDFPFGTRKPSVTILK